MIPCRWILIGLDYPHHRQKSGIRAMKEEEEEEEGGCCLDVIKSPIPTHNVIGIENQLEIHGDREFASCRTDSESEIIISIPGQILLISNLCICLVTDKLNEAIDPTSSRRA